MMIARRAALLATSSFLIAPPPAFSAGLPNKFLPLPTFPVDAKDLTFVISGSAGPDIYSRKVVSELEASGKRVLPLDWRTNRAGDSWSIFSSALTAGENGRRYGAEMGAALQQSPIASVHVVAISAGAFAADALIIAARRALPNAYLRMTILDGFTADGAASALADDADAPGLKSFGIDADFAEAYINTDDPVPSTTLPLRNAVNYDVTSAALRSRFEPVLAERGDSLHLWPAAYYGEVVAAKIKDTPRHGVGGMPKRGEVVMVK